MASNINIIHEWNAPQEMVSYETMQFCKQGKKISFCVLFCLAIIELIVFIPVYMLVDKISTNGIEINHLSILLPVLLIIPIAVSWLFFLYVIYPFFMRRTKYIYKITDTGIQRQRGNQFFTYPWKKIKGYWIIHHEALPQYPVLKFRFQNFTRTMMLPKDDVAQEIIDTFNQNTTLTQNPLQYETISLSNKRCFYLSLVTSVYSLLILLCLKYFGFNNIFLYVTFATLYFGPGTLGILAIYHKKLLVNRELFGYAMVFNVAAFMFILTLGGIVHLFLLFTLIN